MHNISGSVLRAVADWYDTQDFVNTATMSELLRADAQRLDEREAEEKRIDELAIAFRRATDAVVPWINLNDDAREYFRTGVRAVLDALNDDVDVENVDDEPRRWDRIEDVPNGVIVRDKSRDSWRRNGLVAEFDFGSGRDFSRYTRGNVNEFGPFTEVVDGAR